MERCVPAWLSLSHVIICVVSSNLDKNNRMAPFAGPNKGPAGGSNWNDADMLQVGNRGLTLTEQRSHFSLWALIASPLLIGTDLSDLTDDELSILNNTEVIAVNQDSLGKQGVLMSPSNASGTECWAKPLANGSVAAIIVNRGSSTSDGSCTWAELGLQPDATLNVRDLWQHKDVGSFQTGYTTSVDSHAVSMFVVRS
eukprot:TRINITY_DN10182_c0_g1_i7.p2 TRINITY_DN10182_c0_g1~~TRINITY_DN10182_c0_g1_i7.p2  ORF type:complete len:198 (+),score=29.01 TRINITY_DN10182_c0_g1_i7:1334-1927(+)